MVGQWATQEINDNGLLLPMLDQVEQRCGSKVQRVSADRSADLFSRGAQCRHSEERQIDGLRSATRTWTAQLESRRTAAHADQRIRRIVACGGNCEIPAGRATLIPNAKRSSNRSTDVLKEQRGMRRCPKARPWPRWPLNAALADTAYNPRACGALASRRVTRRPVGNYCSHCLDAPYLTRKIIGVPST